MSEHHSRWFHRAVKSTFAAIGIFVAGSILLLWSWNSLAADLFQLPEARFKHAVAFGGLLVSGILFHFVVTRAVAVVSLYTDHRERNSP